MKKGLKKFFIVNLVFAIVITSSLSSQFYMAETEDGTGKLEEITKTTVVAENDNIKMTIDADGHFDIVNKHTKYVWSSYPKDILNSNKTIGINRMNFQSEIVVNYVYKDTFGNTSSYEETSISGMEAVSTDAVTVYKIENGARVVYDFYSICATITVDYTIKNNCISATIPGEGVLEGNAFKRKVKDIATEDQLGMIQESYITSIWLLPAFGANTKEAKGFVFVPDGCGAIMNYSELSRSTENINIPIYGEEQTIDEYNVNAKIQENINRPNEAYFPMFAISQNMNGVMGVISKGDAISSINAYKASKANAYTGVSPQVDYRVVSNTVIGGRGVRGVSQIADKFPDFKVDYYLFDKAPTYTDFAEYYRVLLKKEEKKFQNNSELGLALNIVGAMDIQSHIFGIPCRRVVPLTTYDQANKIISDLKNSSVENIAINYIGWNNNGIQNKKITNTTKAMGKLGGKKALSKLINKTKEENVALYLDADLQSLKTGGMGISILDDVAKTIFDKPSLKRKFSFALFTKESTGLKFISKDGFEKIFGKYMNSANKLDDGAGLSFNSISSRLYSDFSSNKVTSRVEFLDTYVKSLKTVEQKISANDAYSYMWQFVDRIFAAPASSSRQKIYDGEIPMYQMIVHGWIPTTSPTINNAANKRKVFLRAVETGSEPFFTVMYENSEIVNGTDYDYLYGSSYSAVFDEAIEMYNEYSILLKEISDVTISDYQIITSGVSKVCYSNGVEVFVNYNENPFVTEDGTSVAANGFYFRR